MWKGGQEARGEQRGAILAPLALLDTDQPVHTCNVRQLQADDFTDAQARGIARRGGRTEVPTVGTGMEALYTPARPGHAP